MKKIILSFFYFTAGLVFGGGIDKSGQNINILFQSGNLFELSYYEINPTLTPTIDSNVANMIRFPSIAFKHNLNENFDFAIIYDQAFGTDIYYPNDIQLLENTFAYAKTDDLTAALRYKINENFSIYGGLRIQKASGKVQLAGAGFGALDGYRVDLDQDISFGYLTGLSYELPQYGLQLSLTYNSKIKHGFDTLETLSGTQIGQGTTSVALPKSYNFGFQTGINPSTLFMFNLRYVYWDQFKVNPAVFESLSGGGLIDLKATQSYSAGIAHQYNQKWAFGMFLEYEPASNGISSPLSPSVGYKGISLFSAYTLENMEISAALNYTKFGDTDVGIDGVTYHQFKDNSSMGYGLKITVPF